MLQKEIHQAKLWVRTLEDLGQKKKKEAIKLRLNISHNETNFPTKVRA